jgi:hypothetical protein
MSDVKVTVNLPTSLVDKIKEEAVLRNCTVTSAFISLIRQSMEVKKILRECGGKLLIERGTVVVSFD